MRKHFSRREFIKRSALAAGAGLTAPWLLGGAASAGQNSTAPSAPNIFEPTWESLAANFRCPDWFRDAKFGIWAHWSAQCVPEQGDWYARLMYIPGEKDYAYHVANYGHPSKFGFMEIDNLWKAEHWEPEKLMGLYQRAGAKYFVSLANHCDNFDNYDSKHHAWNSVNVGPRKDIVGTWAKVARSNGLRFGVSNHSMHAWQWFQSAYGYDGDGPLAGVRYDAYTLTKADGKGKWWEGLDPQELYTGRNIVMPDGVTSAKAVADWRAKYNPWTTDAPDNPAFIHNWFLRCQDLVDKYRPDILNLDMVELPFGQTGLDLAAHYYNAALNWNRGKQDVVLNTKFLQPQHRPALVEDYERSFADQILPAPWQTEMCIGQWHYDRSLPARHGYKTVKQVVHFLIDVVSKNGNLLLSIPLRGDGTIDDDETAFLQGLAKWMDVNSEGIYETRPWKIYGEGPTKTAGGSFTENGVNYGAKDIRFTAKGRTLYAFILGCPPDRQVIINALGNGNQRLLDGTIRSIALLGSHQKVEWSQTASGLRVSLPPSAAEAVAYTLKLELS